MTAMGSSFLEDDKIVKFAKKKYSGYTWDRWDETRTRSIALVVDVTDPSVDENEFFHFEWYCEKQNEGHVSERHDVMIADHLGMAVRGDWRTCNYYATKCCPSHLVRI